MAASAPVCNVPEMKSDMKNMSLVNCGI